MVDAHYDLLTICYVCYLKNDYTKIMEISKEIATSGVKSIFANLYFMTKEEMRDELGEYYFQENISVLEMFQISKNILENYLLNVNFVYSIEGCDYVGLEDLDDLYKEGLRSVIPVWNHENQYGSGNRTDAGLTDLGVSFLEKAIDLGIGIDLSHANERTFYGMIDVIRMKQFQGKDVICYASHSNARSLCDRARNLKDEQLLAIKSVGGLVGLLSNRNFVTMDVGIDKESQKREYLKHIKYVAGIVGKDKVMVSTDDMRFYDEVDPVYLELPIYDYSNIGTDLERTLLQGFSKEETEAILYGNVQDQIIRKLIMNKFIRG